MSAFIQQASLLSGRQMTMAVTIGLHALVISVLMAIRVAPDAVPPVPRIQLVPVTPEPRPVEPPPTRAADPDLITVQRVVVAPPDIRIVVPTSSDTVVVAERSVPTVDGVAGEATVERGVGPREPVLTGLSYQAIRSTDDYYPPASVTLQEEGAAVVRVCVGPHGRIEGRPVVETTSGSRRLDAAAVDWAREALRFTPATRDGVPVSACKGFRVNFSLR